MSQKQARGLKDGIQAERIKRQIAELWIQHMEGNLNQQDCDRLCRLVDESGLKAFQWGDSASTKYLARVGVWYRDLANYAKSNNCYEQITEIQRLIVDVVFPLGIYGEEKQRNRLKDCASERHQDAFWGFLKLYEQIQNAR